MDNFDFGALLQNQQNHEKKHKSRPTQFTSVASGVSKRLATTLKRRRSSRLTIFDSIRNLPRPETPQKQPNRLTKVEHRKMQLEKWKEEKQQKKQLAAAQKKRPFVAGVAHNPLNFVPPPPPPKVMPSTSGRVTRSQSAKNKPIKPILEIDTAKQVKTRSFAPKNATFTAPEIKNITKVPLLAPLSKIKNIKTTITFEPVLPSSHKVNTKTKLKTQPKVSKPYMTNKTVNQVEKRSTREKLTKPASASSSDSQSSDNMITKTSRKSVESSSGEIVSPGLKQVKTMSTRKKSNQTLMDPVTISEKRLKKIKTPIKSIEKIKPVTPKNPIPKSESSSEEKLRSPKSPVNVPLTPEQIAEEAQRNSPFVTLSRGKANARRETMKKIDAGLLDEDASDMDSVEHFKRQLNSEIKRITVMCDTWEKILESIVLPESVQELVLGAVGQGRLLMSRKLQQFAGLVEDCERPKPGGNVVTPADLHGFWDMVFMQVENVDVRFQRLEELRARNWSEEAPVAPRRPAAQRAKPPARLPAKPVASRLRDVIAAARRAKKTNAEPQEAHVTEPPADTKTFEAGFFCVRSPVRTPATSSRSSSSSLLKAVLSSEATKSANKNSISLAMLRASLLGKEIENGSPLAVPSVNLTPINLYATPNRSILKPMNATSVKKSGKKSIKVVLFNESDSETHDNPAKCESPVATEIRTPDHTNTDSGVSSMDILTHKEQKENKPRRKSLVRQKAIQETTTEHSTVMTRSRRKSMTTPSLVNDGNGDEKPFKRTARKKKSLQESVTNSVEEQPQTRKGSSRRKSALVYGDVV